MTLAWLAAIGDVAKAGHHGTFADFCDSRIARSVWLLQADRGNAAQKSSAPKPPRKGSGRILLHLVLVGCLKHAGAGRLLRHAWPRPRWRYEHGHWGGSFFGNQTPRRVENEYDTPVFI